MTSPHTHSAEPEIDAEKAIALIADSEDRIDTIEWRVRLIQGKLADATTAMARFQATGSPGEEIWVMADEEAVFTESHVRLDADGGRYHAEVEGVSEWYPQNDDLPPIVLVGHQGEYSFDGKTYRQWVRDNPDSATVPKEPSDSTLTLARVSSRADEAFGTTNRTFLGSYGRPTGIFWMPPYFVINSGREPRRLSQQLKDNMERGHTLTMQRLSTVPNVWRITALGSDDPDWVKETVDVDYDVERGIVLGARWYEDLSEEGKPDFQLMQMEVVTKNVDGVWLPEKIALVEWYTNDKLLKHWSFRDVKVNLQLDAADFRVKFPDDAELDGPEE